MLYTSAISARINAGRATWKNDLKAMLAEQASDIKASYIAMMMRINGTYPAATSPDGALNLLAGEVEAAVNLL